MKCENRIRCHRSIGLDGLDAEAFQIDRLCRVAGSIRRHRATSRWQSSLLKNSVMRSSFTRADGGSIGSPDRPRSRWSRIATATAATTIRPAMDAATEGNAAGKNARHGVRLLAHRAGLSDSISQALISTVGLCPRRPWRDRQAGGLKRAPPPACGRASDGHRVSTRRCHLALQDSGREQDRKQSRNRTRTGLTLSCQAGINGRHTLGGCDDTARSARSSSHDFTTNPRPRSGSSCRSHRGGGQRARWLKAALRRSAAVHELPARRATSVRAAPRPPISGTPTSSRSTRRSTTSPSPTRRSSACTPGCCGPKARPGVRRAVISCGATFPTTGRCDGRRMTAHVSVLPHAVEQLQRQLVRLPGPSALLRTSHPPGGALRARRHRDRAGRQFRRQEAQLAQRCRRPPRWQLLVHRSALWRPAL